LKQNPFNNKATEKEMVRAGAQRLAGLQNYAVCVSPLKLLFSRNL
jgi:hypothetical protein